eukprot:TRINITY_DN4573_c0_g1_i1.p1 TRINITY_DN4573_c0_g1~~TRINITY_DN4573_c0_g1_i1.p1  ORF type:complete len:629 (+),score=219.60 TRINITY_DN4573_c0_g1_i1:1350-3236(+)
MHYKHKNVITMLNCWFNFSNLQFNTLMLKKNPLASHIESIYQTFSSSLALSTSSSPLKRQSMEGLSLLVSGKLLDNNLDEKVLSTICDAILNTDDESLRSQSIISFGMLSGKRRELILSHGINQLMGSVFPSKDRQKQKRALDGLSKICVSSEGREWKEFESIVLNVIPQFLTYFSQSMREEEIQSSLSILLAINSISTSNSRITEWKSYLMESVLPKLLESFVNRSILQSSPLRSQMIQSLIQMIKSILTSDQEKEKQFVENVISLFVGKENSFHVDGKFEPFSKPSKPSQQQLILVLCGSIIPFPGSIKPTQQIEVVSALLPYSMGDSIVEEESLDEEVSKTSSQTIAKLINKCPNNSKDLDEYVEKIRAQWNSLSSVKEGDNTLVHKIVQSTSWIAKALGNKGNNVGEELIRELVSQLESDNPFLGEEFANGLDIIMNDEEEILSKQNGANIQMLFKQKIFVKTLPLLIQGFNNGKSPQVKKNHLLAISNLIKNVKKEILHPHIPTILPILLEALQSESNSTVLSVLLSLFSNLLGETQMKEHLIQHIPFLINLFLSISSRDTIMNNRILGLHCLQSISQFEHSLLFKHQQTIFKGLNPILDDRKRLVRKEAIRTKNLWMSISAE